MARGYRFGEVEIDVQGFRLLKGGRQVPVEPKALNLLIFLVENRHRLVERQKLIDAVWGDAFVTDHVLNRAIGLLRKLLDDDPKRPRYIETVPTLGYRFVAEVNETPETPQNPDRLNSELSAKREEGMTAKNRELRHRDTAPIDTDLEPPGRDTKTAAASGGRESNRYGQSVRLHRALATTAIVFAIALAAGGWLFFSRKRHSLTEKDTVVLADFANKTSDPVFDDTLKTALTVSLRQSPFLNVLSDDKVRATLQLMARPTNTPLTRDVTRELCQRAGSKAYIAGSIASLGSEYVLELSAVDCQSGEALVLRQVTAAAKEKVLDALDDAASKLRGQLGESLAMVQKFDVPLAEATTSSLDALKAYSLGQKAWAENGLSPALPYHQHAIELDPNFAIGYKALGDDYYGLGELRRASDYFTKAFALREHTSELEKLEIAATYYSVVTGELDKAASTYQGAIETYPREYRLHLDLGNVYTSQGQWGKAKEAYSQSLRLAPDNLGPYANLASCLLGLQRLDEAQQIMQQAQERKLNGLVLQNARYALAFLQGNVPSMAEQQEWYAGKPEENYEFSLASDTEAYAGHLAKARELTRRSVDSALRADSKETGAIWLEDSALREAGFGNLAQVRQAAAEGLKLAPDSQSVEVEASLAFAATGDTERAESLAQDLSKRYPLDTQIQSLWLPAIKAQLALDRKNPALALDALKAASPIEFGQIGFVPNLSCLYPTYIRGQAYLAAEEGIAAAVEFQKILDHNGIVWNCWTGALAHLGVARAEALRSRNSQGAEADAARLAALGAYKDFLTLWKDADPDIPILKEAKAEYADLQY